MNGGMCVSSQGHRFTCYCQQSWTGPTCSQGELLLLLCSSWISQRRRLFITHRTFPHVQTWTSAAAAPAPSDPGVWTHEAPSAASVRWALTWRMDAPAPEVTPPDKKHFWLLLLHFTHCVFLSCSVAKTFLGVFSLNRQPHDPVVFKSHTVHEIQRELIHLVRGDRTYTSPGIPVCLLSNQSVNSVFLSAPQLNASLSVLRGYSRSMLSRK